MFYFYFKASEYGNLDCVKFLIKSGSNLNESDKYGYTALLKGE